jgi:phosphomethylpyrimidine synthase
MASRIAAHAGDIAKRTNGAMEKDIELARARKALDWDEQIRLSIDPVRARALRDTSPPEDNDVCTMCGSLCAIKITHE